MPKASYARLSSVSSNVLPEPQSSPCARPAQRLMRRRPTALPKRYRHQESPNPFIVGPLSNSEVTKLERRPKDFPERRSKPSGTSFKSTGTSLPSLSGAGLGVVASAPCVDARIQRLERSKAKLKERLNDTKEALKDAQNEANHAQIELSKVEEASAMLVEAQEKVHTLGESVKTLKCDRDKYRRWWLTEYHSLTLMLHLIPNPEDVEAISASSRARYASYSSDL